MLITGESANWNIRTLSRKWTKASGSVQLPILLFRQIDEIAASPPCPNAVLEGIHTFRVAAQHERAKPVQGSETKVASLWADKGSAICLYEVNPPEAGVAVEVHQDAGHCQIVGPLPAWSDALVVDGNWSARGWGLALWSRRTFLPHCVS
jgi:hypothetical protein